MMPPRLPYDTGNADDVVHVACTDAASATQTIAQGGVYAFRVVGSIVYILPKFEGTAANPATTTGWAIAEADGLVEFEVLPGTTFKTICASSQTARLMWYRSRPC